MRGKSLLLCVLLAGCASPPVRYYQLSARAASAPVSASSVSVEVGPVALPVALDRPQLVVLDAERQLLILDQARWAGSLSRMIAQTLADDLARELGLSQEHAFPQASGLSSDYTLQLDIYALRAQLGRGVHLDSAWNLRNGGHSVAVGRFVGDAPALEPGTEGLVAAHDQVLQALAGSMARQLRPLLH